MLGRLALYIAICSLIQCCLSFSDYHERLFLRPLPSSSLQASFNFRSNASSSAFEQQNFRFFPRSLGQIFQHTNIRELHLRFSLGRWDAETWGAQPGNGLQEGGTGVELWAWIEAENNEQAEARWISLTNALSGLFCASLNFIDSTRTIRPAMSFQPWGDHTHSARTDLHLLHGTLPREPVCTENLTPFLKLLPCKGKAGISSLLDGHKLFDATWQSMAIDVRPLCPSDRDECIIEMDQTVDMVLDIERSKRPRENPIPRPVPREDLRCDGSVTYDDEQACFPLDRQSEIPWQLSEIFGKTMNGACQLTEDEGELSEPVCLRVPHEREVYSAAGSQERKLDDSFTRCYKVPETGEFDLALVEQTLSEHPPLHPPPLFAERSFTGYGQERGGGRTLLINPSPTESVDLVYLESMPWFMKVYLHTLHVEVVSPRGKTSSRALSSGIIRDLHFRPGLDRYRPTHLEFTLSVPENSTVTLTYDFEKAILRYTEYPPDANRGFDVPPAIITLLGPRENATSHDESRLGRYSLRTNSLLLPLPTPDFSMPYNVIILTSTVMALAFGSIFTLLIRRFVGADEVESLNLRGEIKRIAEKVKGRVHGARKLEQRSE